MAPKIDHVIVLVMENRSFDHLFGFLDHPDPAFPRFPKDFAAGGVKVSSTATYEIASPDHSHRGILQQLYGLGDFADDHHPKAPFSTDEKQLNQGFVRNYFHRVKTKHAAERVMRSFHPELIPVMSGLAKEYALCTRWFSALPGETWPNRDFIIAGRSFTRVGHKTELRTGDTIFDRVDAGGKDWRIYHDACAHTWTYPRLLAKRRFHGMKRLFDDIANDELPAFAYVEPDYGIGSTHWLLRKLGITEWFGDTFGNSHHPSQAKSGLEFLAGEHLIAAIYNALVETMTPGHEADSVFARTMFVITYDEHGGFFDRATPPATVQPADDEIDGIHGFRFDRLGARVPALIISPWIKKGTLVTETLDHCSIPATVRKLFASGTPELSRRDKAARPFDGVLTDTLRTPTSAAPIREIHALSPAEARAREELRGATRNPADIIEHDKQALEDWFELAKATKAVRRGGTRGPGGPEEKIADPDAYVRELVEEIHAEAP